ncbi:MAG TPA: hypothetical protein VI980_09265 [Acidimicrobiia bacterium]|nr:hypothetical protein [Acidimicrobiia bacterium]
MACSVDVVAVGKLVKGLLVEDEGGSDVDPEQATSPKTTPTISECRTIGTVDIPGDNHSGRGVTELPAARSAGCA